MNKKENAAEILLDKSPSNNSPNECRSRTSSIVDNLVVGVRTTSPPIMTIVKKEIDKNNKDRSSFSNGQIYKNLAIISFAFLMLFTGHTGIVSLQSTLNAKGNVGVNTLIIMNILIIFGSLFLPGISMDIFGLKWTMIISVNAYVFYICANIKPIPIVMYFASALVGLVSGPIWTSQATYINHIARDHAYLKQKKVENVISFFFGISLAIYGTCGVWGSLLSYFVLNQTNTPQKYNCGIHFDPTSQTAPPKPSEIADITRYVLCGTFTVLCILSMILLLALDQIRLAESQPFTQSLKKGLEVLQSFFRRENLDQLLLVPITIWTMMESGFVMVQFTRAFITCLVGIRYVGLILACQAMCGALFCYIFGTLVRYIGRPGCFLIAAAFNYASIILMYFWEPRDDQIYVLYIISGMWGIGAAAWQSQVIAVCTVFYAESDSSAIAKHRLWKAVGSIVSYGYASYVSIQMTLIILSASLTFGMMCYGVLEVHVRRKTNMEKAKMSIND